MSEIRFFKQALQEMFINTDNPNRAVSVAEMAILIDRAEQLRRGNNSCNCCKCKEAERV